MVVGALLDGTKELVAIEVGIREPEQSWHELLVGLRDRQGLTTAPPLAIGDGALGFRKALNQVFPTTRPQRCWVHKTADILNKLPKTAQSKAKSTHPAGHLDGYGTRRRCRNCV